MSQKYQKYTFKVYPQGCARETYRVIEISGTKTLDDLCTAIMNAYDFIHEHLYEYYMDNKLYSDDCYQSMTVDGKTETNIKIDKLQLQKGQNFLLLYDYGDEWLFTIHVQKIEETKEKVQTKVIREKGVLTQYLDFEDEDVYDDEYDEDDSYDDTYDKGLFDDDDQEEIVLSPQKEELIDLALRFKKAALWKKLWDNQVFAVKLRNDEIGYICIMGKAGSFCGMNLYVGKGSYENYRILQDSPTPGATNFQAHEQLLSQNCLQLAFASIHELQMKEFEENCIYSNLTGVSFKGKNAYPQFLKFSKNCYPWPVDDEEELEYLSDAIYAATLLAEELNQQAKKSKKKGIEGQIELDFGETIKPEEQKVEIKIPEVVKDSKEVPCFAVVDDKISACGNISLPPQKEVTEYQRPIFEDLALVASLSKLKHIGIWEAEIIRLTKPVQRNSEVFKNAAPVFPAMIMMVDRKGGNILPVMMVDEPEDDYPKLLGNLAESLQKAGQIPRKILTRDLRTKCFLEDLCEKLGISVSVSSEALPSLDDAQEIFYRELDHDSEELYGENDISYEEISDEVEGMVDLILSMSISELRQIPRDVILDLKELLIIGYLPEDKENALRKKLSKL